MYFICITGSPGSQKHKLSKNKILKVVEQKPGVYTKFKPHLQQDKVCKFVNNSF